jgi:sortase A
MGTRSLIRLELDDRGLAPGRRPARSRRTALRWAEWLLLVVGGLCLGYFLYTYAEASLYQAFEDRELDKILGDAAVSGTSGTGREEVAPTPEAAPRRTFAPGSTVGRIEIPRLGVSAVIRAGSDARTLRLAVGYIPGTALPGDRGNFGLAGHRDTFFRKLRDINPDDEIRIVTTDGMFRYYVQRTSIVMPQDVSVLDPTTYPALTLVTCYPFNYIGSAPKRFIVRAALHATETPARSTISKPADTIAAVRSKPIGTRVAVAKKRVAVAKKDASVRSTVSKSRAKAKVQVQRSTARTGLVRASTTVPPTKPKRIRTTAKPQSTN